MRGLSGAKQDLAAVEEAPPPTAPSIDGGGDDGRDEHESALPVQPCELLSHSIHLLRELEPEVLQCLGSAPVQRGRDTVVTTAPRKVPLGDPCRRPV